LRHPHSFPTRRSSDLGTPQLMGEVETPVMPLCWAMFLSTGTCLPNNDMYVYDARATLTSVGESEDVNCASVEMPFDSTSVINVLDRKSTRLNSSHLGI